MQHQARERHEVQPRHRLRQPLVVPRQPAEAPGPGEGALHHPAPGQQHEAALGVGQFDHIPPDPVVGSIGGGIRPGGRPG